jgi:hypothetical protein
MHLGVIGPIPRDRPGFCYFAFHLKIAKNGTKRIDGRLHTPIPQEGIFRH